MSDIIVAVLGFLGTLLGSLFGILAAQKLTQYRLVKLEDGTKQLGKDTKDLDHRTTKLEGRMDAAETEISDLKQFHRPN